MPEGAPKNEAPRLSQLEQTDPSAFAMLVERAKVEGEKLLKPGQTLTPESYEMIARYVARKAEEEGEMLTRETIEQLDQTRINAMLEAATVRQQEDNRAGSFIVTDQARSEVVAPAASISEVMRIAKEKHDADTK